MKVDPLFKAAVFFGATYTIIIFRFDSGVTEIIPEERGNYIDPGYSYIASVRIRDEFDNNKDVKVLFRKSTR